MIYQMTVSFLFSKKKFSTNKYIWAQAATNRLNVPTNQFFERMKEMKNVKYTLVSLDNKTEGFPVDVDAVANVIFDSTDNIDDVSVEDTSEKLAVGELDAANQKLAKMGLQLTMA